MNIQNYDFESQLEQGFKTLFETAGIHLRIADDIDEGKLPDEVVMLEIDIGAVISDEHKNAAGEYDNYAATLEITIETPRVSNDQIPTDVNFKTRQAQLVATARKAIEEISTNEIITANWTQASAPTKIKPSGTQRENDAKSRTTKLSYEMQFRIA